MTDFQREKLEKRENLRRRYGGLMTLADLTHELGFCSPASARKWAGEIGIPSIIVNSRRKYDTDAVARCLVDRRER